MIEYDLADWDDSQRRTVELLLGSNGIPHSWDGTFLAVPHAREAEADALIDTIATPPRADDRAWRQAPSQPADEDQRDSGLAPPGRRLLGYIVDGVVLAPFTIGLSNGVFDGPTDSSVGARLAVFAVAAAYGIVPVALWGRTVGKLVARTRVVDAGTNDTPTFASATVRWIVPGVLDVVTVASGSRPGVLTLVSFGYLSLVYGGVLWDERRRGLHDRLANTLVVRSNAL